MLLVLAIRRPFAAFFGAGPAYALWLLPALRLVAPPLPGLSAVELAEPHSAADSDPDRGGYGRAGAASGGPGQWVPLLLAIWAVGAAIFLLWQVWTYHRFARASVVRRGISAGIAASG